MGVRVHAARSERDRRLQKHVADAIRSLRRAQDVCVSVPSRHRKASLRPQIDALVKALGLLQDIGHLTPSVNYTDPDLMPDDQRHLLEGVLHLEATENHLARMQEGIFEALTSFRRSDEIRPLGGGALDQALRVRRVSRALDEVGRLIGRVRTASGDFLDDHEPVKPVKRPRRRRDEDS